MRWSAGSTVALLVLVAAARFAAAGESFLDRNVGVHDAIPYEREPPTPPDTPTPSATPMNEPR
jgi:hypothetical protein